MKNLITKALLVFATTLVMVALSVSANSIRFEAIQLSLGEKVIQVEYADTFERRAQGLMHRKELCDQCGMFFKFDSERKAAMWMKNTFIPLDVAFINRNGIITDILPLHPHDVTARGSSKPVLYALEMNQGWFSRNDIKVGDRVVIGGSSNQAGEEPD